MNKYLAEFVGTFGLTLAVAFSLAGIFPVPTPVVAALVLGLFVYTIGHISGTHLNPAITVGIWSIKKMKARDAAAYVAAQLIGAGVALYIVRRIINQPVLPVADTFAIFFAEFIGAFFLAFGVAAVVYGRVVSGFGGIVVGGSLLFGILLAVSFSNGILNPAVAVGINSVSFSYLLGPVAGAILGMWVFKLISRERD